METIRQNPEAIEAVVFDMDGVLFDSREMIYQAMEHVLAIRNITDVTRDDMAGVTGKPIAEMYRVLIPGIENVDDLEREHLAHHDENLHLLQGFDDTEASLRRLRDQNYLLGVFTGFNELTYGRLDQFGIREYFHQIVETTQYKKFKPDPEGLLLCIDRLATTPDRVIYIGDGKSDMYAGKAAGVQQTIGFTQGFGSREALLEAGADRTIDSLNELIELLESEGAQLGP
jgi:HAD superfamily hydrolase (TIGR01549 family)